MFVLDASAIAKLALEEVASAEVRRWYAAHPSAEKVAPHLAWSEVGRALQKAGSGMRVEELAAVHERLFATIELRPVAAALAWRHARALTFHDAQYVALAEASNATLATCDDRMAKAAGKAGVEVVSF